MHGNIAFKTRSFGVLAARNGEDYNLLAPRRVLRKMQLNGICFCVSFREGRWRNRVAHSRRLVGPHEASCYRGLKGKHRACAVGVVHPVLRLGCGKITLPERLGGQLPTRGFFLHGPAVQSLADSTLSA